MSLSGKAGTYDYAKALADMFTNDTGEEWVVIVDGEGESAWFSAQPKGGE